jgi:hypothetical protein
MFHLLPAVVLKHYDWLCSTCFYACSFHFTDELHEYVIENQIQPCFFLIVPPLFLVCDGLVDNSHYEGEFKNGKYHGHGVFERADGMKYEGLFSDGQAQGKGLMTFPDGTNGRPRQEGSKFLRNAFRI